MTAPLPWTVAWAPPALRDLRRLASQDQRRVLAAVERLATTGQGNVRQLTNVTPREWRLRVGTVRVRLRFEPEAQPPTLRVLRVLPRGRAYRD